MIFVGRTIITTVSALLGLLFNGYIIVVLLYTRKVHLTANSLLLLHLGAVDTLYCLLTLAFNLAVIYDGASNHFFCSLHGFFATTLLPLVIWNLCGLNCDRYAAISAPLHYSRLVNTKRVFYFLLTSWILCVLLALPPLILDVNPYLYRPNHETCLPDYSSLSDGPWYCVTYAFCAFALPAVLMIFCNFRILMIATYHRHRIISAIYEVTQRAQAAITHQKNPSYLSKYKGKCAIFTILQLIGSLLALYLPHFTIMLWEVDRKTAAPELLSAVAATLVSCSPPINGFVYGVKSRLLRKTFKNYLRKQLFKSEMTQEFQRRPSTRRPSVTQQRLTTTSSSPPDDFLRVPMTTNGLRRQLSDVSRPKSSPILRRNLSDYRAKQPIHYSTLGMCQVLYVDGHMALHPVGCDRLMIPGAGGAGPGLNRCSPCESSPMHNGLRVTSVTSLTELHYPISVVLKYTSYDDVKNGCCRAGGGGGGEFLLHHHNPNNNLKINRSDRFSSTRSADARFGSSSESSTNQHSKTSSPANNKGSTRAANGFCRTCSCDEDTATRSSDLSTSCDRVTDV